MVIFYSYLSLPEGKSKELHKKIRETLVLTKEGASCKCSLQSNLATRKLSQFLSILGHFQQPKETHLHGVFIPYHPTEIPWYSWYFTTISDGILPPLIRGVT